jgi:tripartite motif-containing protein 71
VEFSFEAVMLIEVLGKWGTRGAGEAQFNGVSHIALDDRRRVYVTDFGLDRVQKFTSDGQLLAQWGGRGSGNGQFTGPLGIAVDYQGNVYVADAGNQTSPEIHGERGFYNKVGQPRDGRRTV